MTNVQHFLDSNQCVRSRHHHSGSHVSEYGLFSMLYGVDAYYYRDFVYHNRPSYPLDVFKENGYAVVGASSSHMSRWGYARLITDQFTPYREFDAEEAFQRDEQMVRWAEAAYRERDAARPMFLFLFFDSTHHDYSYPPQFGRFAPTLPKDAIRLFVDDTDPGVRDQVRNRYKNAVLYVDSLVGDLLSSLADDWRKGELLIVITGDHAEEFWDDGSWGHMEPRFLNA